jgi:hypothetical protein
VKKNSCLNNLLFASFLIPLQSATDWKELKFRSIPANKVHYSDSGLKVEVDSSASPLVFAFKEFKKVNGFQIDVQVQGELKTSGEKFEEDSYLRFGLVAEGKQRPSSLKLLFAPEWIKTLFSLAPKDKGLDKIYFFNITARKNLLGQKRIHPKSDLMSEENIAFLDKEKRTEQFKKAFSEPLSVAGLWISVDGDDTKSKFTTVLKKIEIFSQ